MGLIATERGKSGDLPDVPLYAAAAGALAILLGIVAPYGRRAELLALALLGLAGWTLVEYLLHRFVLHGLPPFRTWHAEHHSRPRALIGTPTLLSATLIAFLILLPALVLSDFWRASALALGLLTGYLMYAVVHHATHHWRFDSEWMRPLKLHHELHHGGVGPPARYGVTSIFWDRVFRSTGAARTHRPL